MFVLDGTNTPFASVIASTTNGGADWTMYETESPAGPGNGLYTVRMVGPTEAWAAGSDGTAGRGAPEEGQLWHSTDLKTWEMFSVASNDGAIITGFAAELRQYTALLREAGRRCTHHHDCFWRDNGCGVRCLEALCDGRSTPKGAA